MESAGPDGTLRAAIVADWRMLGADGAVHEGALAQLVDVVTSLGQLAAGHVGGLSMEIAVKVGTMQRRLM